jgi:hypothetical protein
MFHAIGKQSYIRLAIIFLAWTAYGVFELHPASKGEFKVLLKDGTRLSSTRRYRKNLQSALKV